ncbi:MAG TPA: universal stress protein [Alphaproteobacteria bacterium]|nr:universal stress protein [Alphaproteobacteria bacterium]
MYKRILVPLDGSTLAEGVLPHVTELAKSLGAEVVLLRVAFAHIFPGADPIATQVTAVQEAEDYVTELAKKLQEQGVRAEAKVRYGDAVEEILDHVAWDHIDLIAMATHGRTGLARVVMGSVTEQVLRRAPVPMLLLRAALPPEP